MDQSQVPNLNTGTRHEQDSVRSVSPFSDEGGFHHSRPAPPDVSPIYPQSSAAYINSLFNSIERDGPRESRFREEDRFDLPTIEEASPVVSHSATNLFGLRASRSMFGSSGLGKTPKPRNISLFFRQLKYWKWEIMSWLISVSALVGIVVILVVFEDKPLLQWPLAITINAAIAALAAVSQATLIAPVNECISQLKWVWFSKDARNLSDFSAFDRASRTPAGSLLLLVKQKGLHLASLGALVTFVAFGYGPFVQQIVTFPPRSAPAIGGTATAARAQQYTYARPATDNSSVPGNDMILAMLTGIYQDDNATTPSIAPTCSTGSCAWNTSFLTLGLCAELADVTSMLTQDCALANSTVDTNNLTALGECSANLPNVSFPWGQHVILAMDPSSEASFGDKSLAFQNSSATAIDFFLFTADLNHPLNLSLATSDPSQLYSDVDSQIRAWEAQVRFCIQDVHVEVTDGVPTTTATEVPAGVQADSDNNAHSIILTPESKTSETFSVSAEARDAIRRWSQLTLDGQMMLFDQGVKGESGNGEVAETLWKALKVREVDERQSVLENVLGNMARAMTNVVRQNGDGDPVVGIAEDSTAYIAVRWSWLAFPAALVFLAFVLLLATMVQSSNVEVWKSDSLATMLALSGDAKSHLGYIENLKYVRRRARDTKLRLGSKDGGSRLERAHDGTTSPSRNI